MSRIRVTIDQFVLKGIETREGQALVGALQREMAQVLADPASRAAWTHALQVPVLRLGRMPLEPGLSGGRKFGSGFVHIMEKRLKS